MPDSCGASTLAMQSVRVKRQEAASLRPDIWAINKNLDVISLQGTTLDLIKLKFRTLTSNQEQASLLSTWGEFIFKKIQINSLHSAVKPSHKKMSFKGVWKLSISCPWWCSEAYIITFWKWDRTQTNITTYWFVLHMQPSQANVCPLKATFGVIFNSALHRGQGMTKQCQSILQAYHLNRFFKHFMLQVSQFNKPGWLISQRFHKWVGRLQISQVTYGTYSGLPWVSDLPDSLRAGQSLCRWINLNRRREKRFREHNNWTRM